jgi:hypothetical protein
MRNERREKKGKKDTVVCRIVEHSTMNEIRVSPVVDARAETVAVSFPSKIEKI